MWSKNIPNFSFWSRRAMDYGEDNETGTGAVTELPKDFKQKNDMMGCYNCGTELIWGGDQDINEEYDHEDAHSMVTNLSCPKCSTFVLVYTPRSFFEGEKEE